MDKLTSIDNKYTPPLTELGFRLSRGWNDEIAKQLVELSRQPHILDTTPNDAVKRFASPETAQAWHDTHKRTVYTIGNNAVAGLIWFGAATSQHVPGDYTFAIRMYSEARGKHLARPFMNASQADFRDTHNYDDEIWLDTLETNHTAIALYEKVGYSRQKNIDGRLYMINKISNL